MFFTSKKETLKKAASFAEALAQGKYRSFILDANDPISIRLTNALNQISELLSSRFLEIEKETSHLSGILETIQEGVLLTDNEGRIVLANKALCQLFNVQNDPAGQSLIEIFHQEKIQSCCDHLLKEGGRISFELELGILEEKYFQVNFSSMENEGRVLGVVGVFIDMTQVRKLEKMRKEFVANISHELKTPLSSIKGYSETLLENCPKDPEKIKEFAQIIHRNAQRLQDLVEDIMSLSSLEQKKAPLELKPISLLTVVEEVCQQLGSLAKLNNVSIEILLKKNLPSVLADGEKIKKVFTAIIENAIKYLGEGKKAQIQATVLNDHVKVCIQDNGPGIPREFLSRIFERFFCVETSRSREVGGSGLGLAIAKHIVQAHEGEIWAESELGQGVSFYFTLPIVTKS